MPIGAECLIVTVGYRNPADIVGCLGALARANAEPSFQIHICENGGTAAFDALIGALTAPGGPCEADAERVEPLSDRFARALRLRLRDGGAYVEIGEAQENFGYAGGINAWLEPLLREEGWKAVWVLNPDTAPAPDALAALKAYAETRGKGMVGSRLMYPGDPQIVASRGLKWRRLMAQTLGVDIGAPVLPRPDPQEVDARLDSPHGASFYVTRACIQQIGLMDESYFLYFEELDWGLRAKSSCGVGYAYDSVVPHVGGTTLGSARERGARSPLAVYLDFRNRLLFVRRRHPAWLPWTAAMGLLHAGRFVAAGAPHNFGFALRGLVAGLRGEDGRPDRLMAGLSPAVAEPSD